MPHSLILVQVHAHANSVQARTRDPVEAATGPSAHVYPVTVSGVGHSMQSIPRALGMAALPKRKQVPSYAVLGLVMLMFLFLSVRSLSADADKS